MLEKLFTAKETAEYLGLTRFSLDRWRMEPVTPLPYVKIGRNIRYKESDIKEYLRVHTVKDKKEKTDDKHIV